MIRDLYFGMEEKYYAFLDWLDSKGIGVYALVDPIDKMFPSFILVLIILALLLIGIIVLVMAQLGIFATNSEIIVAVQDKSGSLVKNTPVDITILGVKTTLNTADVGAIKFSAKQGTVIPITVRYQGRTVSPNPSTITINDSKSYTVKLPFNTNFGKISFKLNSTDGSNLSPVNLSFSCSNSQASTPDDLYNYTNQDVSIDVDPDCGNLMLSANSSDYDSLSSRVVEDGDVVALNPLRQAGDSTITVRVTDSSNNFISNVSLDLKTSQGLIIDTQIAQTGMYQFRQVAAGTYSVSASKEGYVTNEVPVMLSNADVKDVAIALNSATSQNGFAKFRVVDKVSSVPLSNAQVCIYKDTNTVSYVCVNTDSEGYTQNITLPNSTSTYKAVVTLSGYRVETINNVTSDATANVVQLSRPTNTSSCLRVSVVDTNNRPVPNSYVYLYNKEDNIDMQDKKLTDINGRSGCFIVRDGQYKAYAYKLDYSGTSELFTFDSTTPADISANVVLTIPDASVRLVLKDNFSNPINNALVKIYDAYNNSESPTSIGASVSGTNGEFVKTGLRSDRKYYWIIEKDGYERYVSIARFLPSDAEYVEEITLDKLSLDRNPKIEVLGVTSLDNKTVNSVTSGELYKINFKATLPNDSGNDDSNKYSKLYLTFVAGSQDIVEKEDFYIERVDSSSLPSIIKGQRYVENDEDATRSPTRDVSNELVNGLAFEDQVKWVQLRYADLAKLNARSGVFYFTVYFRTKDTLSENKTLNFYYSLSTQKKSVSSGYDTLTYPDDSQAELTNITNKKNVYSVFSGKGQQICDDMFCLQATVFDKKNELIADVLGDSPYVAVIGQNYTFNFSITNNNKKPLNNYRLDITNPQESLYFENYNIKDVRNADENVNTITTDYQKRYKIPFRGTQIMAQNNGIKGYIDFEPNKVGTSSVKFSFVEDNRIIYTKEYLVNVVASKDMNVSISPQVIPSFTAVKFDVIATDSQTGEKLKDARVFIYDNVNTKLGEGITLADGLAQVTIPSQNPNLEIKFKVSKDDYKSYETSLNTSANFLAFNKDELTISVKTTDARGKSDLIVTNNSDLSVDINSITLSGDFDEAIDLKTINDYLKDSFAGKTLVAKKDFVIPIVISLTDYGLTLEQSKEYSAKLNMQVRRRDLTGVWNYTLPVKVAISLGDGLDNLECLGLDYKEGKLLSDDSKQIHDMLTITNGCTVKGKPVAIQNIEAKLKWNGNVLGSIVLGKDDRETGLQQAYYRTLSTNMSPEGEETYTVNVVPKSANIVGNNDVEVDVRGSYLSDSGLQFIENKVKYNVSVISTHDCFNFELPNSEADMIQTPRDTDATFKITNTCDNPFDVKFGIYPKDFVEVTPDTFSMKAKAEQTVKLKLKDSPVGVYLLEMYAKVPGTDYRAIRAGKEGLRVFVAPLESDCIVMDNYEYDLYGTNGQSIIIRSSTRDNPNKSISDDQNSKYGYIINRCYRAEVKTSYPLEIRSEASIGEVMKNTWTTGLLGIASYGVSGYFAGKSADQADGKLGALPSNGGNK